MKLFIQLLGSKADLADLPLVLKQTVVGHALRTDSDGVALLIPEEIGADRMTVQGLLLVEHLPCLILQNKAVFVMQVSFYKF